MEEKGATIVSMENVEMTYPTGTKALNGVNVKIAKGEFVFIIGESGSGKSTFVKLLLREVSPTAGKLMVNGKDITYLKHKQVAAHRRRIGCVFQNFRLLKDRNVYENVAFAQKVIGIPNRLIGKNVHRILSLVGLSDKEKALPKELSGGEQQRVALARALVNQPSMLIADEPTGNLDPKNSEEIMHLLEAINAQGTTVIVVTHNQEIVTSMQKRVITLDKGVVARDDEAGTYKKQYAVNYAEISQKVQEELLEAAREEKENTASEESKMTEPVMQEQKIEESVVAESVVVESHVAEPVITETYPSNMYETDRNSMNVVSEPPIYQQQEETEQKSSKSEEDIQPAQRYRTLAEAMQQGRGE